MAEPADTGRVTPAIDAEREALAGTRIAVFAAALDDIHKSKRAAERPKDRASFLAAGEPGRE